MQRLIRRVKVWHLARYGTALCLWTGLFVLSIAATVCGFMLTGKYNARSDFLATCAWGIAHGPCPANTDYFAAAHRAHLTGNHFAVAAIVIGFVALMCATVIILTYRAYHRLLTIPLPKQALQPCKRPPRKIIANYPDTFQALMKNANFRRAQIRVMSHEDSSKSTSNTADKTS